MHSRGRGSADNIPTPARTVTFPGNVQAYVETPIYARTAGYLRKWYVDIGGRVKAGELLATIDTPEVDQQLRSRPKPRNCRRRPISTWPRPPRIAGKIY